MVDSESQVNDAPIRFLTRPPDQLFELPARLRWEVTRRHPNYQLFWEGAARYVANDDSKDTSEQIDKASMYQVLASIGVTAVFPDPATPFEALGGAVDDPAFLTNALQKMTLRSTALMLLAALPAQERQLLGCVLFESDRAEKAAGDNAEAIADARRAAQTTLIRFESRAFDSYPVAALYYLYPGASQNNFVADAKRLHRFLSEKQAAEPRKIQPAKVDGYLKIWDLREGWNGSGYERGLERTHHQIAEEMKKPVSTVFSAYAAAFGYISGHDYNPETWFKLFAFLKYHRALGYPDGLVPGVNRQIISRTDKPIPSSVLSSGERQSFVEYSAVGSDDREAEELETDIRDLLARGLTPEQIAKNLNLDSVELIRAIAAGRTVFLNSSPTPE